MPSSSRTVHFGRTPPSEVPRPRRYTPHGFKPCLHPLLAVLAEVRLVAQLWLRSGNASAFADLVN
jgi:hypothetical protein